MVSVNDCNMTMRLNWTDGFDQEENWIQVGIYIWTINGYMHQVFDATTFSLREFGQKMIDKSYLLDVGFDVEFEGIEPRPPIRFCFHPANATGIIPIVVDLQVLDNPDELARCQIRLVTEPGMLERFGKAVQRLATGEVGASCKLNPELPVKCVPDLSELQ